MQQKWRKEVSNEVWKRIDEGISRSDVTLKEVIEETRYLVSVIEDGGSWYDDDSEEERNKIINECKAFLKKYRRYIR